MLSTKLPVRPGETISPELRGLLERCIIEQYGEGYRSGYDEGHQRSFSVCLAWFVYGIAAGAGAMAIFWVLSR